MVDNFSGVGVYTESDKALHLKKGLAHKDYVSMWQADIQISMTSKNAGMAALRLMAY